MTQPDADRTITVTLTPVQRSILLTALYEKSVEDETYLRGYRDDAEPGPEDICCDAHLARYTERKRTRDALLARAAVTRSIIDLVENGVSV